MSSHGRRISGEMLQYFVIDTSCGKLLVRGVNWIGDSVMTLPALKALKEGLSGSIISLLVKPWVSAVFENNPHIDKIILYSQLHKGVFGRLKLSQTLRREHFCGAILFQNAFDAAIIAFLAGIGERIGYNRDGRGLLLTNAVSVPREKSHQIHYYLNLLEQIGIKTKYSYPYIYLLLDERLQARERLAAMKRPILGINPGATYGSAKRWFPERFAEVATWFMADTGGSVIIFGGNSEVDIADEIYKNIIPEFRKPDSLLNVAGQTALRELISLISECDVFLTNDSGPLHIAYAVQTPMVAIFGSTDPQLTGPPPGAESDNTVIIAPDIPCSPCFERACKQNDMQCMYAVTSDEVYYGIKKILPQVPAVFFDRDGTLCQDTGYINNMNDLHIFGGMDHLKILKEQGLKLIGISNQSGIARGLIDENFVQQVNSIFMNQYGFDDFYYCPHHPDTHCPCRKPEPEMLLRARSKYRIDLKKSFVVGDKEADMILARSVGAKGILVKTGKLQESENADFTAVDLTEAVNWILNDRRF
jgi:lipopolysaccharide heptosyltransferase II